MPRRSFGWLSAIIAVLIVASLAGWLLVQRLPAKPSATLPNGTRITVEAITFGTNHTFTTDSKLQQIMRKILPASLKRAMPPAYTSRWQTAKPEAFVSLSAVNPTNGATVDQAWDKFRIIDEHGCVWPFNGESYPSYVSWLGRPQSMTSKAGTYAFPRRSTTFKLHAAAVGGGVVDLIIPNPVKGPFSTLDGRTIACPSLHRRIHVRVEPNRILQWAIAI